MTACGDGTAQKKTTAAESEATDAPVETTEAEAGTEGETKTDESEDAEATTGGAAAGGSYTDGTYTAEAVGASEAGSGTVAVTVTIKGGKIEDVDINAPKDQASLGAQAIKKLPDKIKEAQSVEVDKVSGATHTSDAIIEAVADCLEQASK
ncbi:MAG: FMN-binding protein [Lachnospiraceae bacterium]|nr:FMN-binding protein [Lachnospiraceae bacterium]